MRVNFVGEAAESCRMLSKRSVVGRMSGELDQCTRLPGLHLSNRSFVPLENVSQLSYRCRQNSTYALVSM